MVVPRPNTIASSKLQRSRPLEHKSRSSANFPTKSERSLGMSPTSRYNYNLKVLRRRDPSIISIFDQFSHVCVYHHNGNKWEKQGYEGSMFLYERDSYPPYGFYILNRMGKDDYIQGLYPEDDIGAHGSYLMMRYYPDFTARRLAAARSSSEKAGEIPHKFSDVYAIPPPEILLEKDKGCSQTVGLWMFATDAREPMIDVMLRLHAFVKRNIPYPEEFRYGPDRPPPPNPHLHVSSQSLSQEDGNRLPKLEYNSFGAPSSSSASPSVSYQPQSQPGLPASHPPQGSSELDLLFAKLHPARTPSPLGQSAPCFGRSSPSSSGITVDHLFAALGGSNLNPGGSRQQESSVPNLTNRGLELLDSLFASATPSLPESITQKGFHENANDNVHPSSTLMSDSFSNSRIDSTNLAQQAPAAPHLPFSQSHSQPFSYPHNSRPTIPHVFQPLYQSHITGPSDAPPVLALTQDVISNLLGLDPGTIASHPHTHSRSSSTSTSSSRLSRYSGDAEDEGEDGPTGSEGGSGYSRSSTVLNADMDTNIRFQADVTGIPQSSLTQNGGAGGATSVNGDVTPRAHLRKPPPHSEIAVAASPLTSYPSSGPVDHSKTTKHPCVSTEANFECRSYLCDSVDDRSLDDSTEMVELDFADTSALSDPEMFMSKVQEREMMRKKSITVPVEIERKKKAKETAVEEREFLVNNGDIDGASSAGDSARRHPSPLATQNSNTTQPPTPVYPDDRICSGPVLANGEHGRQSSKPTVVWGEWADLSQDTARESILAAVEVAGHQRRLVERNEFVRDILTLIHTDKEFVDKLWWDYKTRMELHHPA